MDIFTINNINMEKLSEILVREYVVATGHRNLVGGYLVNNIGGYNPNNSKIIKIKIELFITLESQLLKGHRKFMSGTALGFDTLYFWTVEELKVRYPEHNIQNVIAVPFRKFGDKLRSEQKKWYQRMIEVADAVIYVTDMHEYDTRENIPVEDFSVPKLKARNQFMVDLGVVLVSYCMDLKSGTGQAIRMAQRQNIEIIDLAAQIS